MCLLRSRARFHSHLQSYALALYLKKVAASCKKGGAATNIIYGLALGYLSTIVPIFILASVIFTAFSLCDTCVCAVGGGGVVMRSPLCVADLPFCCAAGLPDPEPRHTSCLFFKPLFFRLAAPSRSH